MNSVREHSLRLTLLFWLMSNQLSGCASNTLIHKQAFAADMQVRIDNVNTTTRLWARQGKLRLVLPAGRNASSMLADYVSGVCWALFPAMATYQEFPTSSLRSSVPHFFSPQLELEKQLIGHEMIEGQMARIYKVIARSPHGREWEGTLWEAEHFKGYPLKWRDAHPDIEAYWKNPTLVDLPESFFDIPDHYQPQQDISSLAVSKTPTCNKRRPATAPQARPRSTQP